ncbi:hypothetical protein JTE90_017382 [Oedothorax gibbosus]|uniref:Uncharacterized protein n=1 Tax=Oedothorax gibbosus TaxID=931172 RepID=A0AAV6VP99_9ARAC|nr:hypothetical protein JTE90_017382 [Oedothorax gibbosus]
MCRSKGVFSHAPAGRTVDILARGRCACANRSPQSGAIKPPPPQHPFYSDRDSKRGKQKENAPREPEWSCMERVGGIV